jgi:hypothetical protein
MLYKRVLPLDTFYKGQRVQIENINVVSVADNLIDEVTLKYVVASGDVGFEQYVGEGAITVGADKYASWDASALGAYQIVCEAIGFELCMPNKLYEFEPVEGE